MNAASLSRPDALLPLVHANRVLHRDIKPENLLLDSNDVLKVADFGVAYPFQGDDDRVSTTKGTPAFMAPELNCKSRGGGGWVPVLTRVGRRGLVLRQGCGRLVVRRHSVHVRVRRAAVLRHGRV